MKERSDQAGQSRVASRQHILMLVGLVAVARLPWDRRFQRDVIVLAIGLAAVTSLARGGQASSLARLSAWDKARNERYLRTAKAPQR